MIVSNGEKDIATKYEVLILFFTQTTSPNIPSMHDSPIVI